MENELSRVLQGYALSCKRATKDKGSFICSTDAGPKYLERCAISAAQLTAVHQLKEMLYSRGFANIDRTVLTAEGELFYTSYGDIFVMSDYVPCERESFDTDATFLKAVEAVSLMHRLMANAEALDLAQDTRAYENAVTELRAQKERILKRGQFSEFDICYLHEFDSYFTLLKDWQELGGVELYHKMYNEAAEDRLVRHGSLKTNTVLLLGDEVFVTRFERAAYGHPLIDLADFIKRYIKSRNETQQTPLPLEKIVAAYSMHNDISAERLQFLKAEIIYPSKYLRLCSDYYAKNRRWTPNGFKSRFEEIVEARQLQWAYIKGEEAAPRPLDIQEYPRAGI